MNIRLSNTFVNKLIAVVIRKVVKKKLNFDILDLTLKDLSLLEKDDKTVEIHLDVKAVSTKKDIYSFIESIRE